MLDALRQDGLAKILAEPNLVAISGRPAHFRVGGQYYYQLNGGITGPSTSYVDYGTIVDVVPLVLGNGRIRLEVRPVVSEIDQSLTVVGGPPSLKDRMVETGVEMKAGQTLAIAGLVQNLVESQNSGLPWISEVPYLGVPFRHVSEQTNEVETLIMVTPELVEPLDANQVPLCGPGMETTSPSDWELFFKGHIEVPVCCNGGGCQGGNGAGRVSDARAGRRLRPATERTAADARAEPRQRRRRQPLQSLSELQSERREQSEFAGPGRRPQRRSALRRSDRLRPAQLKAFFSGLFGDGWGARSVSLREIAGARLQAASSPGGVGGLRSESCQGPVTIRMRH